MVGITHDHEKIQFNLARLKKDGEIFEVVVEPSLAIDFKEGKDIAIFATGTMVYDSIEASKILETKGISSAVINIHTIKPFDSKLVESISKEVKVIVTVEEHSLIGGLGSCVAEAKSKIKNSAPQVSLGLPLQFGKSAHYPDVLKSYNLTAPQIAQNIIEQFSNV